MREIPPRLQTQERDKYRTYFQQGKPREHLLQMDTGHRTLSVASIDPDNFTHHDKRQQITNVLLAQIIHIAAIQETHIAQNLNYCANGYRIITSAPQQSENPKQPGITKGGVAILIHMELEHFISNIQRIDHRIMTITLHDQPKDIPITIAVTYAPHKGYSQKEKRSAGNAYKKPWT